MPESNFAGQMNQWLSKAGPLIIFGCDDVVFVRDVDVASASALLLEEKDLLACSLRLGCNIRFSHNTAGEIPQPVFQRINDLLVWNWRNESSHWRYPFELNGTIYRRDSLVALFNGLENMRYKTPAAEWRHPNLLELRGNEFLLGSDAPSLMYCLIESALVVPTVNCVQHFFDNPLLGEAQDIEELEMRRRQGWELDLDAFHAKSYDRIHVGDFFLRRSEAIEDKSIAVEWFREATTPNPALSVIMATWQSERFIGEAIRSILAQKGIDFELIIIDDASTDRTLQTARSFNDERVAVGRVSNRLKAGAVRNLAARKARAPWLCNFDSDDIMEPGTLADYFNTVASQPSLSWAYCGLRHINADGRDLNSQMRNPFDLLRILQRNIVAHPMSLYTKALFEQAGGYNETLTHRQDYDLWLRFLFFAEPFFYDRLCVRYRRHTDSIGERTKSQASFTPAARLAELLQINPKFSDAPRAELIQKGLAFLEFWQKRHWDAVIKHGNELAALGYAGFELNWRLTEAFTRLDRKAEALAPALQWLGKIAAGETLPPRQETWAMISCLNLLRGMGLREEIKPMLLLAKIIFARHPDKKLAEAIQAAERFQTS